MKDFVVLGTTPFGEDCAQLGTSGYKERALRECRIWKRMLERVFFKGRQETNVFHQRAFLYDFGEYYEVVCDFDTEDEKSVGFAFGVQGCLPEKWDKEALEEIDNAGNGL